VIRAVNLHRSLPAAAERIPDLLVRDLYVAVQLTEERPSARSRLEDAIGRDLSVRLVGALASQSRRAA
jgi:hypothetical protein